MVPAPPRTRRVPTWWIGGFPAAEPRRSPRRAPASAPNVAIPRFIAPSTRDGGAVVRPWHPRRHGRRRRRRSSPPRVLTGLPRTYACVSPPSLACAAPGCTSARRTACARPHPRPAAAPAHRRGIMALISAVNDATAGFERRVCLNPTRSELTLDTRRADAGTLPPHTVRLPYATTGCTARQVLRAAGLLRRRRLLHEKTRRRRPMHP